MHTRIIITLFEIVAPNKTGLHKFWSETPPHFQIYNPKSMPTPTEKVF